MGKRDVEKQSIGQITIGIKEDSLAMETVGFIHRQLSAWRDDSDRTQEQAENKLNLQLCKFLDSRARNEFPMVRFDHEEYQGGNRSVDLSASPVELTMIDARLHTIYDLYLLSKANGFQHHLPTAKKNMLPEGKSKRAVESSALSWGFMAQNMKLPQWWAMCRTTLCATGISKSTLGFQNLPEA